MALRHGAEVAKIEKPCGEVFTPEEIDAALARKLQEGKEKFRLMEQMVILNYKFPDP